MAPSTRHIDDLLEWAPGPSAAASVGVIQAFTWGARRAAQSKWLLVLLWIGYLLVAAGGAGTIDVIREAPRSSTELRDAFARLLEIAGNAGAFGSPTTATGGIVPGSLRGAAGGGAPAAMPLADTAWQALLTGSSVRRLFVATPWFVLFYGLLAGGVVNWLRAPRPAPLLAQLGAACGWYAGRFVRLVLLAAIASALLTWGFGAALAASDPGARPLALLVLCSMLPAAIVDYARVRSVVRDSRSMVLELVRTARFFVRGLPRILLLELLILAFGATVSLLASGIAAAAARLLSAPVGAAIGTQFLIVALLWLRLAAWGAMLSLHQGMTLQRLRQRVT